jgi:hypothetical protein
MEGRKNRPPLEFGPQISGGTIPTRETQPSTKSPITAFCPTAARPERVIQALTAVTNLLSQGKASPDIQPCLCGGKLFVAKKKCGGHRPIAVGEVLRRLVSKCMAFQVAPEAAELQKPLQLSVGVPGGCEAIIHAVNAIFYDTNIPLEDKWILQVNMKNAFNLVDRSVIFDKVCRHLSAISPWVEFTYGSQSFLYLGMSTILSCLGAQQGDPLASLLFTLAVQPLLKSIKNQVSGLALNIWFLDDGTFIGKHEDLIKVLEILQKEGPV